ncbi:MAG: hypothetical protein ABI679_11940 [Gemmatimonadota bacterium]
MPRIIGPGVVSTPAEEFKATISPDGRSLLYVVTGRLFRRMTIVESTQHRGQWGLPRVVPFSGVWRDGDPAFTPDGSSVYFISNRPMPGDPAGVPRRDFNIWMVHRTNGGTWEEPTALARGINTDTAEFAPSLTATGNLYFSRGDNMFSAKKQGSGFDVPVRLPMAGGDPAVSPDEQVLVFDANGPVADDADLFLSCRTATGWTEPSRLAEPVNTREEEGDPAFSADGRTLYFFSRHAPPSDRAPRSRPATYAEVRHEALDDMYNGSRNLFAVTLASVCGTDRGS